jgi:hypothetical protein
MQKINLKNVKWTFKNKNLRQSHHLKPLKIKKTYIKKFSMHFTNKFLAKYIA